ncbi:MAG: methyltransferase domain-containing protein [Acidobacteriota bacterium]|jgi:ubiquinone/menaquinone biosynthesis C-methylase UbiE
MPWRSPLNAEIYDRFVREGSVYGWLNRRLVKLADLAAAPRILDLACGTGATTIACLHAMGARAEIVAIDSSEAMVEVARANILDPRARFEVLAAAEADRLEGDFPRVVCCAAFWQFPSAAAVFRALARRTRPGARLVFNVPAERVEGEPAPVHAIQAALTEAIAAESGHAFEALPTLVDPASLRSEAADHGFEPAGTRRLVYEGRQGELVELMSIPAMIGPITADLDRAGRDRVLERVAGRVDPSVVVEVPWIYFTFVRR